MQVINNGILKILIPEKGYKLVNKESGFIAEKVYLCLSDSPDNYAEIVDEDYMPVEFKIDYKEFKDSMNETIDIVVSAIDDMFSMFEPLLMMMPMAMSMEVIEEPIVAPMAKLYFLMIQRGLKTLDEIPEKFKTDVIKLMNN
jgi:hypothetical protein